ncbi:MAG: hypothetical protein LAP87_20925 [Acidobacteriia bacterium]|nr:hypothetical protein [Terriglobia bacterium]
MNAARRGANADVSARPGIEVRADGVLIRRVAPGAADALVARGWGEWMRTGRRRYVRLTEAAPLSSFGSRHVGDGTRPLCADQTCKTYGDNQVMGDPRKIREFSQVK